MSNVVSARKIEDLARARDPRMAILEAVGDLEQYDVMNDLVLTAVYIRNEKMAPGASAAGNIIRPKESLEEDQWQGKVGLVLKTGPDAYGGWEEENKRGLNAKVGTWVVSAVKDGWPLQINGVACRLVPYDKIRMRLTDPAMVF